MGWLAGWRAPGRVSKGCECCAGRPALQEGMTQGDRRKRGKPSGAQDEASEGSIQSPYLSHSRVSSQGSLGLGAGRATTAPAAAAAAAFRARVFCAAFPVGATFCRNIITSLSNLPLACVPPPPAPPSFSQLTTAAEAPRRAGGNSGSCKQSTTWNGTAAFKEDSRRPLSNALSQFALELEVQ